MKSQVHREITLRALEDSFGARPMQVILRANLRQDSLPFQFGHDHFHFDSNRFDASYAYMEEQRGLVRASLERGDADPAWRAFGRLIHAAQDFYAHSDYIPRWLKSFNGATPPAPEEVDPVSSDLIRHPDLRSGKLYYPLEALTFLPKLGRIFVPLLPRDSHAHMNMDGPDDNPHFAYAFHAAIKRTRLEFERTSSTLRSELLPLFTGTHVDR